MSARIRLALLGIWAGALFAWLGVFVPAVFANVPPTGPAARLIGASLDRVDQTGLVLGLLVLGLGVAWRSPGAAGWVRACLPAAAVLCQALSLLWISPHIRGLREAAGGSVARFGPDDPRVELFGTLHSASTAVFAVAALAVLGTLVWDLTRRSERAEKSGTP